MNATLQNDMLMLVRQQIDANLTQIADAASGHNATPDNKTLAPCVLLAHQVAGALRMVQLPGAARFGSEIESALKTALRGAPADSAEVNAAAQAASTLREFIGELAAGGSYVPLRLYPAYRDLARISGSAAASEKDLFFPPLQDNAPAHANPRSITPAVLPALVKDLRSRFQRGLLAWLKDSAAPDGPKQMRTVLDQLHQIAAQLPEPRGLWWAGVTLIDAVIELMPNPQAAEWITRVKPVCSRIDFLLRDLAANARVDGAPAQRDVYFAIASCRVPTVPLRDAQRLLQLEHLIPDALPDASDKPNLQPLLDDTRKRIENIKDVWTEYIAGEPNRLGRFRELLAPLTQKARDLGNLPLLQLLLAISGSTSQLPDPYPLDGQVMSLEMASALLMAESITRHFHGLPADLEQQVTIMKGWLAEAVTGKIASSSPPGLRADIVQKANDEKLRIATAREILKNLQQVERAVEAFTHDPAKRHTLAPLAGTLRQVQGVFEVSNQKRAARLALACQHLTERCAHAPAGESARDIEWLAEGLACLGFYLDPCLHGKEPAERAINLYFTRYEKQEGLEALLGLSQQISIPKTDDTAVSVATVTTPLPAAPGVDAEMLEVFLEEANEVLTTMESSIAQARKGEDDGDALINVRRGFHTLKGSSRMVGLSAYGECAWEMEQLMNHWLTQAMPATPGLLDLCTDARTLLTEWAHALRGEATPAIDASDIARRARVARGAPAEKAVEPAPALPRSPSEATTRVISKDIAPEPAPTVTADVPAHALTNTITRAAAARDASPAERTLADLGERLSVLTGLIDEMQQEAKGAAHARLPEIADSMKDSLTEARDLQRRLHELLAESRAKT